MGKYRIWEQLAPLPDVRHVLSRFTRGRPRRATGPLAAFGAVLVLSSCASSSNVVDSLPIPPEPSASAPDVAPSRVATAEVQYPVGLALRARLDFLLSDDDNARLYKLWQQETSACMVAKGFDNYVVVPYQSTDIVANPLDLSGLERYGYHTPSIDLDLSQNDGAIGSDPAFEAALFGNGDDDIGCLGDAQVFAYGDDTTTRFIATTDSLISEFMSRIYGFEASDEGRHVAQTWRECLRERGYEVTSRDELSARFSDAPSVSAEEIEVRLIDYDCDVASGFTVAQSAWESARADQWLDENAAVVAEASQLKEAYLTELAAKEAGE